MIVDVPNLTRTARPALHHLGLRNLTPRQHRSRLRRIRMSVAGGPAHPLLGLGQVDGNDGAEQVGLRQAELGLDVALLRGLPPQPKRSLRLPRYAVATNKLARLYCALALPCSAACCHRLRASVRSRGPFRPSA